MPRITLQEANAWVEKTKLTLDALDANLLTQIENQVLARLGVAFDSTVTSTWLDAVTTPKMVRSVIAMLFMAWHYDRNYSEDQEQLNDYAVLLRGSAEALITGILDGSVILEELPPGGTEPGGPAFYPTDASSALCPTDEDPSLGGEYFSMGTRF